MKIVLRRFFPSISGQHYRWDPVNFQIVLSLDQRKKQLPRPPGPILQCDIQRYRGVNHVWKTQVNLRVLAKRTLKTLRKPGKVPFEVLQGKGKVCNYQVNSFKAKTWLLEAENKTVERKAEAKSSSFFRNFFDILSQVFPNLSLVKSMGKAGKQLQSLGLAIKSDKPATRWRNGPCDTLCSFKGVLKSLMVKPTELDLAFKSVIFSSPRKVS